MTYGTSQTRLERATCLRCDVRLRKHFMKTRKFKILFGAGVSVLLLLGIAGFVYVRVFHRYPPAELMQDIRAGIAAREIKDPDERFKKYLEQRYGPMSDAANRQKAFLDFFNAEHIRALQFMVKHSPTNQRQANIQASADWIAKYRTTMTPQERAVLSAQLQSETGKTMLRKATAQYNEQDVYYRGNTAPVISQLLTTIHEIQKQR